MLADCAVVSHTRLWASPVCNQQNWVHAAWQLTRWTRRTRQILYLSKDATSTTGAITAHEQVYQMTQGNSRQMTWSYTRVTSSRLMTPTQALSQQPLLAVCAHAFQNSTETHEQLGTHETEYNTPETRDIARELQPHSMQSRHLDPSESQKLRLTWQAQYPPAAACPLGAPGLNC